jgi:hypothetical protein
MHQQIRTAPSTSAADVEKLLGRLAEKKVNIAAAGGGDLEFGGEFAFAVDHDMEDAAIGVLEQFEYPYRLIKEGDPRLTTCYLENKPGELHRCIREVADANLKSGRIIRDLIIGVPDETRKVPVQIFSEEVRTPQTLGGSGGTASQPRKRAL